MQENTDKENNPVQLNEEQIVFVRSCIMKWLTVKETLGKKTYAADAIHSSLLTRLLEGKSLLPIPPPKRFSYPDYDLAEGKTVSIMEIWEDKEGVVVIDQEPAWKWVNKDNGVLMHEPTGDHYMFDIKDRTIKRLLDKV